ncbi:ABC transporter ATP-binding protein [Dictyobacter aurantiacus]|uniref:ABC transporter ATP-binding protein n=1 Tax=Dictyobacter aurantiacus TaxID=1936993 RepID=A0A401ZE69_9CHLR|nr:ABC transporter ATP-binding protein [Dictyobacter aurantiacus]GCE05177.1 ABC transporter ATP-binding protein [Dictyobacter aurantiacus]
MGDLPKIASHDQRPSQHAEMVVRTEELTKRFDTFIAVDHLGIEIYRGDVYGLLGPNGSGKTTTIRMLLGLIHPTSGQVTTLGYAMSDEKQRYRALQHVGAIVEQPVFYPFLTGRENLRGVATFGCMARNQATEERIEEVLELVDMATRANDSYSKYSLGMKQRLALAATLVHYPQLIILDEPTNGLDPAGVVEIRELIGRLSRQGITILLSSHQLHEIQQVCSRVAIIKRGKLLVQGNVQDLLSEQQCILLSFAEPDLLQQAELFLHTQPEGEQNWMRHARIVTAPANTGWTPPGGQLLEVEATMEQAAAVNAFLAERGIYATEIRRRETSLEQYFLELTATPLHVISQD